MAQGPDAELIHKAYDLAGPQLKVRVLEAIDGQPLLASLMIDVAKYIIELRKATGLEENIKSDDQPAKKRKLNGNHSVNGKEEVIEKDDGDHINSPWHNSFLLPDISFVVPQRKKLSLELGSLPSEGIRAVAQKDSIPEFFIQWTDIEHVVCLPVPEKATVAHNFCIFPKYGDGVTSTPENVQAREPMVWTINDPKVKEKGPNWKSPRDSIIEFLTRMNVEVLEPTASEFVSEVLQAHRKGEKAYHVKAFRGSKDGFLFFLPTGIVWGFKKPLYFFSFATISSISYTSVLQRTFNLSISILSHVSPSSSQEFEFSMIDQADFAGIDAYVKRHQLQDASMAEQRRAKKLNINGVKSEKEANNENAEGELEKARREVEGQEDEDDEEEDDENFDPGSEGESEGSGDSSDEEGGEEGTREGDLVQEELGSEAEKEEDL